VRIWASSPSGEECWDRYSLLGSCIASKKRGENLERGEPPSYFYAFTIGRVSMG